MIINTTESGVKVAIGAYKGSGTYGDTNPNILTFAFRPRLLIIQSVGDDMFDGKLLINLCPQVDGDTFFNVITLKAETYSMEWNFIFGSWNDTTVTWYAQSADDQLNIKNLIYQYFAIG